MNAIKQFGLGILYAVLFPFILAIAALIGVFGVLNFLYQGVLAMVNFFSGKKIFPPFKEDKKAYDILQKAIDKQNGVEEEKKETPPPAQNVYIQQNYYQQAPNGFIPSNQPNMQIPNGFMQNPQIPNGFNPYPNQIPNEQLTQIPLNQPSQQLPNQQVDPSEVIDEQPKDIDLLNFPEGEKK